MTNRGPVSMARLCRCIQEAGRARTVRYHVTCVVRSCNAAMADSSGIRRCALHPPGDRMQPCHDSAHSDSLTTSYRILALPNYRNRYRSAYGRYTLRARVSRQSSDPISSRIPAIRPSTQAAHRVWDREEAPVFLRTVTFNSLRSVHAPSSTSCSNNRTQR